MRAHIHTRGWAHRQRFSTTFFGLGNNLTNLIVLLTGFELLVMESIGAWIQRSTNWSHPHTLIRFQTSQGECSVCLMARDQTAYFLGVALVEQTESVRTSLNLVYLSILKGTKNVFWKMSSARDQLTKNMYFTVFSVLGFILPQANNCIYKRKHTHSFCIHFLRHLTSRFKIEVFNARMNVECLTFR